MCIYIFSLFCNKKRGRMGNKMLFIYLKYFSVYAFFLLKDIQIISFLAICDKIWKYVEEGGQNDEEI